MPTGLPAAASALYLILFVPFGAHPPRLGVRRPSGRLWNEARRRHRGPKWTALSFYDKPLLILFPLRMYHV